MEHNLNWLKLTCIGVVKFSIVVYWSIVLSVYKFNIMPGFRKMVLMKLVISPKLVIPTCMKVQGSMYKSFKIKSVFFQFLLLHGILLLLFCTLPIFFSFLIALSDLQAFTCTVGVMKARSVAHFKLVQSEELFSSFSEIQSILVYQ